MAVAEPLPSAPVAAVDRPEGPVIAKGRGMHVLKFVPLGGFVTKPIQGAVEDTAGPEKTVNGPSSWKNGRPVYEHGNYGSYYSYRHGGSHGSRDLRLAAIAKRLGNDVFHGLEVLDLGCNAGLVSLEVSRSFGARRVVGTDIDAELIETAKANRRCQRQGEGEDSASKKIGKVTFRNEDILSSPLRRGGADSEPERFDAILCFSLTKWIHFTHGDAGVKRLFRRCRRRLKSGGLFILEPQDWASYKKKRHLTRDIRQTVAGIELRPEEFRACLVDEIGFESIGVIDPPAESQGGFKRRSIYLFRKPANGNSDSILQLGGDEVEDTNTQEIAPSGTALKRKHQQEREDNKNEVEDAKELNGSVKSSCENGSKSSRISASSS